MIVWMSRKATCNGFFKRSGAIILHANSADETNCLWRDADFWGFIDSLALLPHVHHLNMAMGNHGFPSLCMPQRPWLAPSRSTWNVDECWHCPGSVHHSCKSTLHAPSELVNDIKISFDVFLGFIWFNTHNGPWCRLNDYLGLIVCFRACLAHDNVAWTKLWQWC
jgi:hypothetical protein